MNKGKYCIDYRYDDNSTKTYLTVVEAWSSEDAEKILREEIADKDKELIITEIRLMR